MRQNLSARRDRTRPGLASSPSPPRAALAQPPARPRVDPPANGMAVVLIGTGIPLPNPDRGTAATLVLAGKHAVLVDTGRNAVVGLDRDRTRRRLAGGLHPLPLRSHLGARRDPGQPRDRGRHRAAPGDRTDGRQGGGRRASAPPTRSRTATAWRTTASTGARRARAPRPPEAEPGRDLGEGRAARDHVRRRSRAGRSRRSATSSSTTASRWWSRATPRRRRRRSRCRAAPTCSYTRRSIAPPSTARCR